MASFYVIRGKDNGQHFPIRGAVATIGREAVNQIRLRDTEVSRNHARVLRTDVGAHQIADNGSSNGTYVNSRRIDKKLLQSGDRVQVGRTLLIYTGGPEPQAHDTAEQVEIVSGPNASDRSQILSSLEGLLPESRGSLRRSSVLSHSPSNPTHSNSPASSHSASFPSPSPSLLEPASSPAPTRLADSSFPSIFEQPGQTVPQPSEPSINKQLTGNDWEIIYQVSQAISRTGDLDELLVQVLDLIFQWIDCDHGCFLMLDDVTGQLMPSASRERRSRPAGDAGTANAATIAGVAQRPVSRRLIISRTILDHVVNTKEGVLTSNAQDDARWEQAESIANLGVQEAICVPMIGRYGLVGAIYVDTSMSAGLYAERQGRTIFEHQHLKLMLAIAGQAALAIEDTQFYLAMLQAERLAAMGQTIANLSHHVKNILQGVRGGSYLVDDGLKKQDLAVISRGWTIVQRNQERISNLVMDMLSFSKDREPELLRCDLNKVIDEVVELMAGRAAEHSVVLDWQRPQHEMLVDVDSEAMHRAVLNVVTNAIDAVSQFERADNLPGRVGVAIELSQLKNFVRIHVADNGPGIAQEELGKIFSPFESTKGARGTGLGLPVSQKTLREHGGDITIDSRVGEGTTFTLQWPAYSDNSANAYPSDVADDWSNRATL